MPRVALSALSACHGARARVQQASATLSSGRNVPAEVSAAENMLKQLPEVSME